MPELPEELKYAATHEWSKVENDTIVVVGITEFAQEQLGDIVFLELPEPGTLVKAQQSCAVVESVKTASDLYSPVTGTVLERNEKATDEPDTVNETPYETWLFKIKAETLTELDELLDAEGYQSLIKDQ
ncbi:MAG: glycine cleavage system protein GcvH [Methylococcales bacterium]